MDKEDTHKTNQPKNRRIALPLHGEKLGASTWLLLPSKIKTK